METHAAAVPVCAFDLVRFHEPSETGKVKSRLARSMEQIVELFSEIPAVMIEAPSVEDFKEARERMFPYYSKLSIALSNLAVATLTPMECAKVSQVSYARMGQEFTTQGLQYLGNEEYQEALFSISSLKSAQRWIPHLVSAKPDDLKRDAELARRFALTSLWSQFHLDCLLEVVSTGATIETQMIREMLEGMRSAVMAYGCVREALDLRKHLDSRYSAEVKWEWDEEDESLANAK